MIVGAQIFSLVLTIMLFTVGMLFIANFKLRKPSNKVLLLICLLAAALIFSFVQGGGMQWHAVPCLRPSEGGLPMDCRDRAGRRVEGGEGQDRFRAGCTELAAAEFVLSF